MLFHDRQNTDTRTLVEKNNSIECVHTAAEPHHACTLPNWPVPKAAEKSKRKHSDAAAPYCSRRKRAECDEEVWKNAHWFSVCPAFWRSLVPSSASLAASSLNPAPLPHPNACTLRLAFAAAGGWRVCFQCRITTALLRFAVLWCCCPKQ